jgi:hypothetical protein
MEYYSPMKKNEVIFFAHKWIVDHHVKQCKPGSEAQRSHVFTHVKAISKR